MAAHTNNGKPEQQAEVYDGVSITEFKKNTRTIYVEWFGRKVRVEYMPGNLDDDHFIKLDADEAAGKDHREWTKGYFLRIVHSVPSLTMDDGSPFLITAETEPLLPMPLKNRIVNAITEDLVPKGESENELSNTSSPKAKEG